MNAADWKAILSDPQLIQARDLHFERLRSLFAGTPQSVPFCLNGIGGYSDTNRYTEPEKWVCESLCDLASRAHRLRDERVFRPLFVETWHYGVHFVDKILGAEVYDLDGECNWQARYLTTPVGELQPVDLDINDTWNLAMRTVRAFVETGVTVPLYGLPVIASALNIAINLYGQEIIIAMYTEPDAAHRDLAIINDTICEMHQKFRAVIPESQLQPVVAGWRTQPPGSGQICGCSTQLLSPELYTEFIAPLDDAVLSLYPNGGLIHLCGTHTQHISAWREMKSMRALQLNDRAAEDLEIYFNNLREDQILYVNPFEDMPVDLILEITGGRRTVIVGEMPE